MCQLTTSHTSRWRTCLVLVCILATGCQPIHQSISQQAMTQFPDEARDIRAQDRSEVPTELNPVSHPTYVIEPPDILNITAVKIVPKAPYLIEPLDVLQITVLGTLLNQPIAGIYAVDTGGMVQLGSGYGAVKVAGLSIPEAAAEIDKQLKGLLRQPQVSVILSQTAGQQQIVGQHLVGPDGTVNLGTYGTVYVSGLTIVQARASIEKHLSQFLEAPKISVEVFAYNSKVYYVVTEGGGQGDRVVRVNIMGKETVLDAISQIGGLTQLSSNNIWIARPSPGSSNIEQILPVNWSEIIRGGSTATNYQILPGDRVFIEEDRMIALGAFASKVTGPFERILGFLLLGTQSVQAVQRFPKGFRSF